MVQQKRIRLGTVKLWVPSLALPQWVKNLTAVVWVAAEVQVQSSPAQWVKGPALL